MMFAFYSRTIRCGVLLAGLSLVYARSEAGAQSEADRTGQVPAGFEALRPDGNKSATLQSLVSISFSKAEVGRALQAMAAKLRLNLTVDPDLPGLEEKFSATEENLNVAQALLRIIGSQPLSIYVAADNQLIVLKKVPVAPIVARTPAIRDTIVRLPQRLDTVRSFAKPVQRDAFELKPNVGTLTMTTRDLGAAPSFIGADLLRQMQLMPGVEARNDYSAALNVRGGESDQNLILLDGYPIYNPFHVGGVFSTFIEPMVGSVELMTAAFPAKYGGRLSSVMDVRSAEESQHGVHGAADISMLSTSLSAGGALAGENRSWMVAYRRTYADRLAALGGAELPYHFQDAQAHVTYSFGALRVAATGYAGLDEIKSADTVSKDLFQWGNRVGGITLARSFTESPRVLGLSLGDSVVLEQKLSATQFYTDLDIKESYAGQLQSRVNEVRLGGSVSAFSARHERTLGYDVARYGVKYDAKLEQGLVSLFLPIDSIEQRIHSASLYYDELWRVAPSLILRGGARADLAGSSRNISVLPRLSAKFFVTPDFALTLAASGHSQWMHSLAQEDVPARAFDAWVASDSLVSMSTAWHLVAGGERWFSPTRSLRVEAFSKRYQQLPEANQANNPSVAGDEFLFLSGTSNGLDVFLRQLRRGKFEGWMSYSYSVNKRRYPDGIEFYPGQDRRHDLNAVGSWHRERTTLGLRLGVATGTPYTPIIGEFYRRVYDPVRGTWSVVHNDDNQEDVGAARNSSRIPLSHRIDASIGRNVHLRGAPTTLYLSVINVYNARNVFAYVYDFRQSPPKRATLPQFPLLPSFGVKLAY